MRSRPTPKGSTIFLHIPKTAGATIFYGPMLRQYRPEEVYNHGLIRSNDLNEFLSLPRERKDAIRLLHGHMAFGLHEQLKPPVQYVTILREPTERTISYFYYQFGLLNRSMAQVESAERGLEAFVNEGTAFLHTDNGQTRLLCGEAHVPFGQVTREMLETAKKNLDTYFTVVGLTEDFLRTLFLMKVRFGWKKHVYFRSRHVNKARPKREHTEESPYRAIRDHNQLDMELYDYGRSLFTRQLAETPIPGNLRLAVFPFENRVYGSLYGSARKIRNRLRAYVRPHPSKSGSI